MAHKHAALMAQYSADAWVSDKPWELWEYRPPSSNGVWYPAVTSPDWRENTEYRRKPVMVTRTITYPEPCREALEKGQIYYLVQIESVVGGIVWGSNSNDIKWLAQGRIHLSRENAEAHRVALLGGGEK